MKMDNTVKLDNGTFLTNHVGKYKSGLTLLHEVEDITWLRLDYKELNLEYADLEYLEGEFFTSKKGTKCFRIKSGGNQLLLRDNWGGSFAKYFGGALRKLPTQYYVRASSNGGGNGYDYAVIMKGTKQVIKEDDI